MDYTCCWDCGWGLSTQGYVIAVLLAFDLSLVIYRRWQSSQTAFPATFRLAPRGSQGFQVTAAATRATETVTSNG